MACSCHKPHRACDSHGMLVISHGTRAPAKHISALLFVCMDKIRVFSVAR